MSDLKEYEEPRQLVIDNTESFLNGLPANNCLLYGDRGTGKSSTIKAILNQYYTRVACDRNAKRIFDGFS